MPNAQHIHTADPPYAPPVIRPPSPASSVGTEYGPDQTALSDAALSDDEFEHKWMSKLDLDGPKDNERDLVDPLIQQPKNPEEEKVLFHKILNGFRAQIQQLDEDEMFEQMLLRGSRIGLEKLPTSDQVDDLMRDMMDANIGGSSEPPTLSDGPWNRTLQAVDPMLTTNDSIMTAMTAKNASRGKAKSP